MLNTIANLFNGNLEPIQHFGKHNEEINHLEELIQRNAEEMEKICNDAQKDRLEKLNDCINEYLLLTTEQAFCDGFCVATKLITEALAGAEHLL